MKLLQGWKPNYRARFVIFWTDHFSGLRREMSADKYCQTICVQKPNVIFPCVNNKTDQLVSLKFSLLVDGQFYSFVMFFLRTFRDFCTPVVTSPADESYGK